MPRPARATAWPTTLGAFAALSLVAASAVGNGDYTSVEGLADEIIFADGFESGDTSAWSD